MGLKHAGQLSYATFTLLASGSGKLLTVDSEV
jgi:hypothetical protein